MHTRVILDACRLQEEIIPFFQSLELSKECTTAADCYLEISEKVGWGSRP
jgi:hypothetical protein